MTRQAVPEATQAPPRWRAAARLAARPVLIAVAAAIVLFVAYELVESHWFSDLPMEQQHRLQHISVVVIATIAVVLSSWLLIRSLPASLRVPPVAADGALHRVGAAEQERQYALWFIRMRWTAFVITAALVFLSVEPLHQLPPETLVPLLATTTLLGLLNAWYGWLATRPVLPPHFLELQAYVDLALLTVLLHFSGGLENPLGTIMLLHVIIAGAIMSRAQCYLVATAATLSLTLMAFLEWTHATEHYTLAAFPHHSHDGEMQHGAHYAPFVLSRLALHGTIMYLTAYFATTLAARIRADERELEHYADRLLAQTRELERSLDEQRRAQQMVVRAERLAAVGELAGKVAHEVNNPIGVISAKARLLLSDERAGMSPRTAAELEKMVGLSDRVAGIARGLLSYGRPSPAARALLDVTVPLRHALAHAGAAAAAAGVRIADRLPASLPPVMANAGEMEQVFLNLFLNALDAMPGGGTLTVGAEVRGGEVVCRVGDTGGGIPAETRERIFEPFYSTKAEGKGTGLGLAICAGLVGSHGGRIEVASEVGRGTTFTITLPLAAGAAA